jgi:hypothetical protein
VLDLLRSSGTQLFEKAVQLILVDDDVRLGKLLIPAAVNIIFDLINLLFNLTAHVFSLLTCFSLSPVTVPIHSKLTQYGPLPILLFPTCRSTPALRHPGRKPGRGFSDAVSEGLAVPRHKPLE